MFLSSRYAVYRSTLKMASPACELWYLVEEVTSAFSSLRVQLTWSFNASVPMLCVYLKNIQLYRQARGSCWNGVPRISTLSNYSTNGIAALCIRGEQGWSHGAWNTQSNNWFTYLHVSAKNEFTLSDEIMWTQLWMIFSIWVSRNS